MIFCDRIEIIGNGKFLTGDKTIAKIAERMGEARHKHKWPDEALGKYQALGVIGSEFRELEHAVEKESDERVRDELLDVIVTAIRMYQGEHIVDDSGCEWQECSGSHVVAGG